MIGYIMSIAFKVGDDLGLKFKAGVIATNMYLHDR
jgi:hypothetical protein